MKKTALLIGILIGFFAAFVGAEMYLMYFTKYSLFSDFNLIQKEGILGKIITLGSILNLMVFFILIQTKRDMTARGVVLATLILAISTLFI